MRRRTQNNQHVEHHIIALRINEGRTQGTLRVCVTIDGVLNSGFVSIAEYGYDKALEGARIIRDEWLRKQGALIREREEANKPPLLTPEEIASRVRAALGEVKPHPNIKATQTDVQRAMQNYGHRDITYYSNTIVML